MRVKLSRWEFLKSVAGLAGAVTAERVKGNPLGLPLGIQLYTVRKDLPSDFAGTLQKLKAMGYAQLEAGMAPGGRVDFKGGTPKEFRKTLDQIGLEIPSCHFEVPADDAEWNRNIEAAHALRLEYMLCAGPPEGTNSLDAWKRAGDFFNHLGKLCRKAGIQFAYHNHNAEYRVYHGSIAYDVLLRSTDPELVKMEMDCFWTTFAGKDPVAYLEAYPGRFPLLHIKDLKPGYKPTTGDFDGNPFCEVGKGTINWQRIFASARKGGLKHYYVEQDQWDRPSLESAQISSEYLKRLNG